MSVDDAVGTRMNVRFHRLAEQVADHLRRRILTGDLQDGSLLPKEDLLREEYPVSKPSLREAMRILEAEGLITVRRGNTGGAVVHRPSAGNVAYTLGLVLGAQQVTLADVAAALVEVEPACAALCARRSDRRRAVVAPLRRIHKEAVAAIDDLVAITTISRRYHETLVESCGNQTLIMLVGALEALWSAHESNWASRVADHGEIPIEERLEVLEDHKRVIDAIEAGDASLARELAAAHLAHAQRYPGFAGVVDPVLVRDRFIE